MIITEDINGSVLTVGRRHYLGKDLKTLTCLKVSLTSINDVKQFVGILSQSAYDVDLASGKYVVDAKSLMGIFSLDLQKPLDLRIDSDDCSELLEKMAPFIIK